MSTSATRFPSPSHLVLPSVASADLLALGGQVEPLVAAGATLFHFDVMDGQFVPNVALGSELARQLSGRLEGRATLDVHLMVSRPGEILERFLPLASAVSVHLEADPHPHRLLGRIREAGCHAGLAINPGTPIEAVAPLIPVLDYVVVMGVNPGFSGQSFIPETVTRVRELRTLLPERVMIEVDGGVDADNVGELVRRGANWLVSASAIFGAPDPTAMYEKLQAATTH